MAACMVGPVGAIDIARRILVRANAPREPSPFTLTARIVYVSKDATKPLRAFGVASRSTKVEGTSWASARLTPIVDKHDHRIADHELEGAAYGFVKAQGGADTEHDGVVVADLIESLVLTPEKRQAMASLGVGVGDSLWWVGFEFPDRNHPTARRVGNGDLGELSIEGDAFELEAANG